MAASAARCFFVPLARYPQGEDDHYRKTICTYYRKGGEFHPPFCPSGGEFHPFRGESFTQNNPDESQGFQQLAMGETLPFPAHRLAGRGAIAGRLG
jgi:hypothetical protein